MKQLAIWSIVAKLFARNQLAVSLEQQLVADRDFNQANFVLADSAELVLPAAFDMFANQLLRRGPVVSRKLFLGRQAGPRQPRNPMRVTLLIVRR